MHEDTIKNCFDVFKESANEKERGKKMDAKFVKLTEIPRKKDETVKMSLQKGDIYHGTSSNGTVYFVPKCLVDALNETVVTYIVKGGETTCETFNPNIDEGLGHILEFPIDFYDKLNSDLLSAEVFDISCYDKNDRWTGMRRPRITSDPEVLDCIEYMNQKYGYKVNIRPTGFYLLYEQSSPYLDEPYEAVEYIGDDNRYYYISVAEAQGKKED